MNIFELLRQDNYYGISETVEIAKGKNKAPKTFKESFNQIKRKASITAITNEGSMFITLIFLISRIVIPSPISIGYTFDNSITK